VSELLTVAHGSPVSSTYKYFFLL